MMWDPGLSRTSAEKQPRLLQEPQAAVESELVEYDFDTAGHSCPGDWNTQRESLLFYEGTLWYERFFDYAKSPKSRLFVHFGACNYLAAVYLNGEELGEHEGGFTPFDFEITDRVKAARQFSGRLGQ